jgi:hypothetical protein
VLTELAIKNFKAESKPYRKTDGGDLYRWPMVAAGVAKATFLHTESLSHLSRWGLISDQSPSM